MISKLDEIQELRPQEIVGFYQKVFNTPEGELVLIDLMIRFGEFKPSANTFEAGNQAVLIYIKNRMLGIVDQQVMKGPVNDESND